MLYFQYVAYFTVSDLLSLLGHADESNVSKKLNHRVFWKDIQATKGVNLEFDEIPFIILGHRLLECQNGPDGNRAPKERQANTIKVNTQVII